MTLDNLSNGGLSWKLWHLVAKIPEGYATICPHNYCTDWNATMVLAIEHGVSVLKLSDGYVAISKDYDWIDVSSHDEVEGACIGENCYVVHDKNPLRAVVICLIKILEA